MKQHITKEQMEELSAEAKLNFYDQLCEWGTILPNIGQMIEFLVDHELPKFSFEGGNAMNWWGYDFNENAKGEFLSASLLCDKLWEAVKEVLKNETLT